MTVNEHDPMLLTCARAGNERLIEILGVVLHTMMARRIPAREIRFMVDTHLEAEGLIHDGIQRRSKANDN